MRKNGLDFVRTFIHIFGTTFFLYSRIYTQKQHSAQLPYIFIEIDCSKTGKQQVYTIVGVYRHFMVHSIDRCAVILPFFYISSFLVQLSSGNTSLFCVCAREEKKNSLSLLTNHFTHFDRLNCVVQSQIGYFFFTPHIPQMNRFKLLSFHCSCVVVRLQILLHQMNGCCTKRANALCVYSNIAQEIISDKPVRKVVCQFDSRIFFFLFFSHPHFLSSQLVLLWPLLLFCLNQLVRQWQMLYRILVRGCRSKKNDKNYLASFENRFKLQFDLAFLTVAHIHPFRQYSPFS